MVYGIIYKAENIINGKVYIGQTTNSLSIRKTQHYSTSDNYYFHKALRTYKKSEFLWEEVCRCYSKEELDMAEKYFIYFYDSYNYGYNLTLGGLTREGYITTEETREKIRRAKLGNKNMLGHKHTIKSKIKMSESVRGAKHNRYGKFGAENPAAKKFVVTDPNGNEFVVHGLRFYCEETHNNALKLSNLSLCARGLRCTHKGYKCRYFDPNLDLNIEEFNI